MPVLLPDAWLSRREALCTRAKRKLFGLAEDVPLGSTKNDLISGARLPFSSWATNAPPNVLSAWFVEVETKVLASVLTFKEVWIMGIERPISQLSVKP